MRDDAGICGHALLPEPGRIVHSRSMGQGDERSDARGRLNLWHTWSARAIFRISRRSLVNSPHSPAPFRQHPAEHHLQCGVSCD